MATPAQWIEGARPRTLPAAIAPVARRNRCCRLPGRLRLVEGAAGPRRRAGPADRRELRQRLLRRHPRHGREPGRAAPAGRLEGGQSTAGEDGCLHPASASARVLGVVLCATSNWWLLRRRRRLAARGVVLHRRQEAVRVPRARRGQRLPVLRAGRCARYDLRAGREAALDRCRRCSRPSASIACALLVANNLRDIPTDTETGKRTLAVVLGAARLAAALRGADRAGVHPGRCCPPWPRRGLCSGLIALPLGVRAVRVVVSDAVGPALIPVLKDTGLTELVYAVGLAVGWPSAARPTGRVRASGRSTAKRSSVSRYGAMSRPCVCSQPSS